MVSVVLLIPNKHGVISYDDHIIDLPKVLVEFPLEYFSNYCYAKWHYGVSVPAKFCIEGCEVRGGFI